MLKETIKRAVLGFGIGIIFLNIILILKSALFGNGSYIFASRDLIQLCGTEFNAVLFQFILTGLMGLVFGSSTMLFEAEKLSILQATIFHFLMVTPIGTIIGWFCNWMVKTKIGVIAWIVQFIIIYIIVWLIIYLSFKKKTRQINEELSKNK